VIEKKVIFLFRRGMDEKKITGPGNPKADI